MPESSAQHPWGAITFDAWQSTPCVIGRRATESDVRDGRAVFFVIEDSTEAIDTGLPRCALLREEGGSAVPVVIIQVEKSNLDGTVLVGYRPLSGSNGICTLAELELLDRPNELFR